MEESENGYPKMGRGRKSGEPDPYQKWVFATYHALVRRVVESNNWGLNIVEITAKLGELLTPEYRQRLEASAPKRGWKMPKGKPTRKIVGDHLNAMCTDHRTNVAKIGGGYYIVDSSSSQLNASVREVLQQKKNLVDWNISLARNLAGCYTVTDPAKSHGLFFDLFQQRVNEFIERGYWLKDILAYMIRYDLISSEVYSKQNGLDRKMLREGWKRCFGNTRLLVLAYAVSPPDFLEYMMSPHGNSWATNFLDKKWDSIMNKVKKRPRSEFEMAALSAIRERTFPTRSREV